MSRIDELTQELCPQGVEYEEISKLIVRSEKMRWDDFDQTDEFRYIDLGTVDRVTHSIGDTETITKEKAPSRAQQVVREGDVLFGTTRPMLKRYCVVPSDYNGQVASTGFCVLRVNPERILTNYLFHLLGTAKFYDYIEANERGASYPAIPDNVVKKFRIPVPPLEVQHEIVQVLDKFTQLEAELEAELEARRAQYDYYFRGLLSFGAGDAQELTLGDIGRVAMCKRVFKSDTSDSGDVPFFKIGTFGGQPNAFISRELFDSYRERFSFPNRGDILISAAGTIGRTLVYDGQPAYFQDSNIVWLEHDESIVKNAYLKHWYKVIEWTTDGGTIRRLYNSNLLRARILVPPPEVQDRIATMLDTFDGLVNDISIGLPAELSARRKQYEYYRDRLLTFQEAV